MRLGCAWGASLGGDGFLPRFVPEEITTGSLPVSTGSECAIHRNSSEMDLKTASWGPPAWGAPANNSEAAQKQFNCGLLGGNWTALGRRNHGFFYSLYTGGGR